MRVCLSVGFTHLYFYILQSVYRYSPLQVPQMVQHSPVIDLDAEQAGQECNSDTVESSPQQVHDQHMEYSVKVVPPDRKAGYQVHKLRVYTGKKICECKRA